MAENLRDPRTYFKFTSCSRCLYKPCDMLRFGGVHPGKFNIVHNSQLGLCFFDCQFVAQDFDEIEQLLLGITFEDFVMRIHEFLSWLTPSEYVQWHLEDFIDGYSDVAGRIKFIQALWERNVLSIVRIPQFFMSDEKMRKWLYAYEGLVYMLKKPELEDDFSKPALTDALIPKKETPPQAAPADEPEETEDEEDGDEDQENPTDGTVSVRLNIDPNDPDSQDDTFTLYSTDDAKTFSKEQTVKDDQVPGDNYTDLKFTGLDTSLSYSLEINLGKDDGSYFLFEDVAYEDLNGQS